MSDREVSRRHPGTVGEVFRIFLRLGLTSFGGPVAHLGYFREAFVARRKWLDDDAYADLVALCQFLPGPASSQVGMAIGLQRAGYGGLLAAWFAFTLPSAVLLVAFAYGFDALGDALGTGWLAGVKAAAVAIVAGAVLGMAKSLTPDARRATIAGLAAIIVLLIPSPAIQLLAIAVGAALGLAWVRTPETAGPASQPSPAEADAAGASSGDSSSSAATADAAPTGFRVPVSRRAGAAALTVCAALLLVLPALSALTGDPAVRLAEIFSRAGALVFGGGHVVLPLLETETVRTGLVDHDTFLAGYGAAQAVPGPLFTFAAFLGASTTSGPSGILGASIALIAIFLPAALLTIGALPFWQRLHSSVHARRALLGVNAAVVGLLGAALFDPVFIEGVTSPATLAIAIAAFIALTRWNVPAWAVVLTAALIGWIAL
ncbi:chromate efflux transporter [Brevibacterium casei]|uniref:Chromate transporter n=2 Tax=Brevibacterium casei TaxID=33889 RepID=K9AS03_9MICO|nr:chromate efflux transporter [Brevibacterium casei]SIH88534.1 chromate transport protein ChrA [Mycobacteroides abscessus subsp. abscessus]EKU48811.1 chromate transporter [Brevibacterium casei S18]KZE23445.1 chromate transporter [Brevibacterium casei]MBE4693496.1 chromate efflux transporter [Brevibacterium casei]MBY3576619.1 chromate efflux transporter [Brevibacterium casei]